MKLVSFEMLSAAYEVWASELAVCVLRESTNSSMGSGSSPARQAAAKLETKNSCTPHGRRLLLWASIFRRLPRQLRVIATMT